MDINECKRQGFIKITTPNASKAASLLEIADLKEEAANAVELNEKNINAYFPLAYDSLRETLEALCLLLGYNVTNHICLGELLKEISPGFDYTSFDRFRYARNGINYYGRKIGLPEGEELIKKMFEMKKNIKNEVNARMQNNKTR